MPGELPNLPPSVWVVLSAWAALSAALGGFGTWLLAVWSMRSKSTGDSAASETAERNAFRATLIADISTLRLLIKECELDRERITGRLNSAEEQITVLKASAEITTRWVEYFKLRSIDAGLDHVRPIV